MAVVAQKGVFKLEYIIGKDRDTNWTAMIFAHSSDEAERYLRKTVGNVIVSNISQEARVDAISDEIRDLIVSNSTPPKKKPGRPPKVDPKE
jgi:hypothetical protein